MQSSLEVFMDKRSRKTVIITSIVLLLAGITGIALPQVMSMAAAFFVGWLMPSPAVWLLTSPGMASAIAG